MEALLLIWTLVVGPHGAYPGFNPNVTQTMKEMPTMAACSKVAAEVRRAEIAVPKKDVVVKVTVICLPQ